MADFSLGGGGGGGPTWDDLFQAFSNVGNWLSRSGTSTTTQFGQPAPGPSLIDPLGNLMGSGTTPPNYSLGSGGSGGSSGGGGGGGTPAGATPDPQSPTAGATASPQQQLMDALNKALGQSAAPGPAGGGPAQYVTPDGVTITAGSAEDRFYSMADKVWTTVYGGHPPFSIVDAMRKSGIQNTDQLQKVLDGMPSHIPGVTIGEYEAADKNIQAVAQNLLGRPMPDSLTAELVRAGQTSKAGVQLWFDSHPVSAIPKDDFHAIWDAANQWTQGTWNTTPHPNQIAAIHAAATAPSAAAPAKPDPASEAWQAAGEPLRGRF